MPYTYNETVVVGTPHTVTSRDLPPLANANNHACQVSGGTCAVALQIANNPEFIELGSLTEDGFCISSHGVTAIRFTATAGPCSISLAGDR